MKSSRFCNLAQNSSVKKLYLLISLVCLALLWPVTANAAKYNASPPETPVKLIFIHHSCGENWLTDGNGDLGRSLGENNYFVSDTNYGWGPDSIGDRTDIVDWPEWFTGPNSKRYLKRLYTENAQHSSYSRTLSDPGGENSIVMFKSCYPNSNLEGNPNDRPGQGEGLSVGNAKAIYNRLLNYFASRPDRLFIVITAPPVQDRGCAANARAFNKWLVKDWLAGYKGKNVAVFDFYNVLTAPKNHHRYHNGKVEHISNQGGNTLYYPSNGDDHPSTTGNRKATREFVPLLNTYYHRWQDGGAASAKPQPAWTKPSNTPRIKCQARAEATTDTSAAGSTAAPQVKSTTPAKTPTRVAVANQLIDNFDVMKKEWDVFQGEGDKVSLKFARDTSKFHSGSGALRIEYTIDAGNWASCSLVYPAPRDWKKWQGVSFYIHGERAGQQVAVTMYQGSSSDSLAHFEFKLSTTKKSVKGWQKVDLPWNKFSPPPWEDDSSKRFNPAQAMGLAFIFSTPENKSSKGRIWIDDLMFLPGSP